MRTHVPVDCCLAFRIVYFSIRIPETGQKLAMFNIDFLFVLVGI